MSCMFYLAFFTTKDTTIKWRVIVSNLLCLTVFFFTSHTCALISPFLWSMSCIFHLAFFSTKDTTKQGRLLQSAIGNFPGQKVTCPVISNSVWQNSEWSKRHAMHQYLRAHAPSWPCPFYLVVERLTMKHSCEAAESDASGPSKKPKCRQVSLSTSTEWQAQLEREHQTMTWLHCDTDESDPTVVDTLWCHARRTSEAKIIGMKNYSRVSSSGSANHKTT